MPKKSSNSSKSKITKAVKKAAKVPTTKRGRKKKTDTTKAKTSSKEKKEVNKKVEELALSEAAKKILQKRDKNTPVIFKLSSKKNTPIFFSLDEVNKIIQENNQAEIKKSEELRENLAKKAAKTNSAVDKSIKVEQRKLAAASLSDILGISAQPPSKSREKKDLNGRTIPDEFKKYYDLLIDLHNHVFSGLDVHTKDTLKRSSREDAENLASYSQHMGDVATDAFDRDFALSLVANEQEALNEINYAIERIFDGSYGICQITGKPIHPERLMAVPFTRFSIEGQTEHEKNKKKTVQSNEIFTDIEDDDAKLREENEDE